MPIQPTSHSTVINKGINDTQLTVMSISQCLDISNISHYTLYGKFTMTAARRMSRVMSHLQFYLNFT